MNIIALIISTNTIKHLHCFYNSGIFFRGSRCLQTCRNFFCDHSLSNNITLDQKHDICTLRNVSLSPFWCYVFRGNMRGRVTCLCTGLTHEVLTNWGRDEMAAIFQTTFSNAFSWMKMCEFRFRFHWIRIELTIFQHWLRQAIIWTDDG